MLAEIVPELFMKNLRAIPSKKQVNHLKRLKEISSGAAYLYKAVVKSVVRNGAKGTQTALTLETPQNKLITGYMQGNPDLRDGQIICNVKIEERESAAIGKYNIIRGFEKAA